MTKIIEASCVQSVVSADGVTVPAAEILSEGIGTSDGILVMDGEKAYYIPKAFSNLKSTLDSLSDALGGIASALTLIDAKVMATTCPAGPGTAGPTPLAASDIAAITTAKAEIDTLKGILI